MDASARSVVRRRIRSKESIRPLLDADPRLEELAVGLERTGFFVQADGTGTSIFKVYFRGRLGPNEAFLWIRTPLESSYVQWHNQHELTGDCKNLWSSLVKNPKNGDGSEFRRSVTVVEILAVATKYFELGSPADPELDQIWEDLDEALAQRSPEEAKRVLREVVQRLGQPRFRDGVLRAYNGKCAFTGCNAEPAIDAAHIKPFSESGEDAVSNGVPLRADIHRLFDRDLIAIHPEEHTIVIHASLLQTPYTELNGKSVNWPSSAAYHPDHSALTDRWEKFRSK